MRLTTPRIAPLTDEASWTDAQRSVLAPMAKQGRLYNIFSTLGHNPDALQAFLAWGSYVLRRTQLGARERELAILRVGYLCRSGYEWAQHWRLGKQSGLTDIELANIKLGVDAAWSPHDRTLIQATDELHRNYFISDGTWRTLQTFLDERQCMDLVFIVAHYTQVCMMLNTFGIQLDVDLDPDPDLVA
jgi:4-carboxymuconolactone decarboxylase